MTSVLSRRKFLLGVAATAGTLTFSRGRPSSARAGRPASLATSTPAQRVVHTHSDLATYWDYATGWYGDCVSQAVVDRMTDLGVMDLTGAPTRTDAWRALIPGYAAGQKVAIKINLNNATSADSDRVIDALPQPVNAVIRGLKAIGIPENDVCVYDASRPMPSRLVNKIVALYPTVQFDSNGSGGSPALGFSASERVHFDVPPDRAISDRPISVALAQAAYLINMPIMKKHAMAGVTLGFKNHFGSIESCDLVHWSVTLGDEDYLATYNGLVDIYSNPHFKDKTVLTVGDGLYGARINNYSETPSRWPTFGGRSPNSLFFSRDPVALDCVMYDFLAAEGGVRSGADDYLLLAEAAGLGAFEHRDASGQYHTIDYRRIEVDTPLHGYLPLLRRGD